MSEIERKKRGRPAIGVAMPVRMTAAERSIADLLGGGKAALGIRTALAAAAVLGVDVVLEAASRFVPGEEPLGDQGEPGDQSGD